jgi:hypothetical protein
MNIPSNDSSAGNSDRDNNPDPHLIEDGASPAPLLIPSVVIPITAAPLDSTPVRNDMIMDATLDAKFLEHRSKMSISMRESILATQHALEKLIQGLPESAIKPRASSITIQIDKLAGQLARVDQTLENYLHCKTLHEMSLFIFMRHCRRLLRLFQLSRTI